MNNMWKEFKECNRHLFNVMNKNIGMFVMIIALLLVGQVLSSSMNIFGMVLLVVIETSAILAVIYLMQDLKVADASAQMAGLKQFIMQKWLMVFACYILVSLVVGLGFAMFLIPGLIAFFFLHFAPLFVAVPGSNLVDAMKQSYHFALKIMPLNLVLLFVQCIMIVILIDGYKSVYFDSLMGTIIGIYIISLKTAIFLRNYQK